LDNPLKKIQIYVVQIIKIEKINKIFSQKLKCHGTSAAQPHWSLNKNKNTIKEAFH
jgi:hypothetical protein